LKDMRETFVVLCEFETQDRIIPYIGGHALPGRAALWYVASHHPVPRRGMSDRDVDSQPKHAKDLA
jgi:hypothetical protein